MGAAARERQVTVAGHRDQNDLLAQIANGNVWNFETRGCRSGRHRLEESHLAPAIHAGTILHGMWPLEMVRSGAIAKDEQVRAEPPSVVKRTDPFKCLSARAIRLFDELRGEFDRRHFLRSCDELCRDRDTVTDVPRARRDATWSACCSRLDRDRHAPIACGAFH